MTHLVILDPELSLTAARFIQTVDISAFEDTDYLSVTLPDYPGTKVIRAESFLDLTSNTDADFEVGPTDTISFSDSDPVLAAVDGDAEGRFPIGALTNIDRSLITAVRFRVSVTDDCDVKFMGLRAVSADWEYASADIDTLHHRAGLLPSPTGDPAASYDFPVTADGGMPTDFPIVFRSDDSPGARDPRPVDINFTSFFATGSLIEADGSDEDHYNTLAFYIREIPVDNQIQLELDGITQAALQGLNHQPDFGRATSVPREQSSLDILDQTSLEDETMHDLETLPDYSNHQWIEIKLRWADLANVELTVKNADDEGYEFSPDPLDPIDGSFPDQGFYIVKVHMDGTTIQVKLYESTATGEFGEAGVVFDTGLLNNQEVFFRRGGRVGWYTQFLDGDAFVYNVRAREANYGDLISQPFSSLTPVKGASLFTSATTDRQLITEIDSSPWGVGSLNADPPASATGKAYRVVVGASKGLQGIQTNRFLLDSFQVLHFDFNIKFPSDALTYPGAGLDIFLYGEYGRCIPLNTTPIVGDRWESVRATLPDDDIQSGTYSLVLVQRVTDKDTTWWIEGLSCITPVFLWEARNVHPDPWGMAGNDWLSFVRTINKQYGGIVFEELGKELQLHVRALRQDAVIDGYKLIPKYAELGRFIWDDD